MVPEAGGAVTPSNPTNQYILNVKNESQEWKVSASNIVAKKGQEIVLTIHSLSELTSRYVVRVIDGGGNELLKEKDYVEKTISFAMPASNVEITIITA